MIQNDARGYLLSERPMAKQPANGIIVLDKVRANNLVRSSIFFESRSVKFLDWSLIV